MYSQKDTISLTLLFTALAAVQGNEDTLLNYRHTDAEWQWVTKYRLAEGNGWARDSETGKYVTCDVISTKINSTDSWMVSDFIQLNSENVVVHLSITFTARQCDLAVFPFCKTYIGLYKFESDVSKIGGVSMESILAGNFTMVGNAKAARVWTDKYNIRENVYNVSFPVKKNGVYLAFRDIGACVALSKVRMTSYHCPSIMSGGAVFNKTGAPMPGQETKVRGECLGMSYNLANGSSLYLGCYSNGTWSAGLQITCQCKVGYQPKDRICQACPAGFYKFTTGNTMCQRCPDNSYSNEARTGCACKSGYYKATTDPQNGKCTAPPSSPRHPSLSLIGPRFILLSWQRPMDDGGRNDLLYSLSCYRCHQEDSHEYKQYINSTRNVPRTCNQTCGSSLRYTPSANDIPLNHVTISGLVPGFFYSFRVTAKNGVSSLVQNAYKNYADVSTFIPRPDVPKMFVSFVGSNAVVLSWPSDYDNHSMSSFYYSMSCAVCDKQSTHCVTSCKTQCGNAIQYKPGKDKIDVDFAVISQLIGNTRYKFTLSVTEHEDNKNKAYRSKVTEICVTTKRTSNASVVGGPQHQCEVLSLFSKIALGISGGFFLLAVTLLVITVSLRNKWYRTAKSIQNRSNVTSFSYNNELKPMEKLVILEETNLKNTTRR